MYERILVPIDGSATATRGLDEAIQLARLSGARLRLLHLVDALSFATGFETGMAYTGDLLPLMRDAGQKLLDQAKARADAAGVPAETELCERLGLRLSDLVLEQAGAWPADLVVIGTHGRRGVRRLLLGSDAEMILRTSPVPVLLVRAPDQLV